MKNNLVNTLFLLVVFLLISLTLFTKYYGSADINDYSDTAKFFAGKYSADIRSSHSYLFGFIHSPFVKLTNSFISFKITSLIFLFLIVYSVYKITKRKESLILIFFSPIIWYIAPWISPIQAASLAFLWAYYFINEYCKEEKKAYLFYSGLLIGAGWAIWDTVFYFGAILSLVFLFNRRFSHFLLMVLSIFMGMLPRLILDQILFNFAFFTTIKTFVSGFVFLFSKGIYGSAGFGKSISSLFLVLLSAPLYFWGLYKPRLFRQNKKEIIFLSLSLLLILFTTPQVRYTLIIIPLMILVLSKHLTKLQIKKQILFSFGIIIFFMLPYIVQTNNSIDNQINGIEATYLLENKFSVFISKSSLENSIRMDLEDIVKDYPFQTFLVLGEPDSYQSLAHIYWGDNVKEFVSVQDYELYLANETILFKMTFMPNPNINNRRQIWLSGGISKNEEDKTNFAEIEYAVSILEPVNYPPFVLIKQYGSLYLYEKQ